MATIDDFWKAIRKDPENAEAKLIVADYLEEHGDGSAARAFRWCVARDRWPLRITGRRCMWLANAGVADEGTFSERKRAVLPLIFFVLRDKPTCNYWAEDIIPPVYRFKTEAEAIQAVGEFLDQLEAMIRIPESR